jgi:hypothetical protein
MFLSDGEINLLDYENKNPALNVSLPGEKIFEWISNKDFN